METPMNRPDFIAARFGAVICAAILDDYRSGRARNVTVAPVRPDEARVM
jgi:hypothetical protein